MTGVPGTDLLSISFLIALGATAMIGLIAAAFSRSHFLAFITITAGMALSLWLLLFVPRRESPDLLSPLLSELLALGGLNTFFIAFLLGAAILVSVLSYGYFRIPKRPIGTLPLLREERVPEYYLLLLMATLGAVVVVTSAHFSSLFLGVELLSVSLYPLIAYPKDDARCLEAGAKYLILAGTSSAFLVFGMALLYASSGSMKIPLEAFEPEDWLSLLGTLLLLSGVGFKLTVAPFHFVSPDIYEGAPAPITAFMGTVSKGAPFVLLLRLLEPIDFQQSPSLFHGASGIAAASMLTGSFLALGQRNLKRLLAYSAISQMGYLLIPLLSDPSEALSAASLAWMSYLLSAGLAIGVVSALSEPGRETGMVSELQGMFWERPFLALALSVALLSLAGIPLTSGFVAKLLIASSAIQATRWLLLGALILSSALGIYYYLRVVLTLFGTLAPSPSPTVAPIRLLPSGAFMLLALTALVIWVGVYPSPWLSLIENTHKGRIELSLTE